MTRNKQRSVVSTLTARSRHLVGAVTIAMVAATFTLASGAAANASTSTAYNATPASLPPNVASLGFQATSTSEFGDHVTLGGTDRSLDSVTVTMSDWALYSDYSSDVRYSGDSAHWTHPITVNVYADSLDVNGVPDTLLATTTSNVTIPWRPAADPTCPGGTAWRATDSNCYNGYAFNATFDLSSANVTLPDSVIVGVAFNTQSYGATPEGSAGPYNSLNVGIPTGQTASVGSDVSSDAVFWNTSHAAFYADGGAAGVGTFREDTAWSPNGTVAFKIATSHTDTLGACQVSITGSNPTTYTLLGDCITDQTIVVPQNAGGSVFDGNGHSITAVDPTGGHFLGAVVQAQAGSDSITVENLTVTASSLATACDAGNDRLRGILFDGVSGTITNNTVTDIQQGTSGDGCQEGNAIDVRNTAGATPMPKITISDNVVTNYQKTGIIATLSTAATITNNTVTGYGPVTFIAQNGIQVSLKATAKLVGNDVSKNNYSPSKVTACGLLIYKAGGVSGASKSGIAYVKADNDFHANEQNICNFGKGGSFSPAS